MEEKNIYNIICPDCKKLNQSSDLKRCAFCKKFFEKSKIDIQINKIKNKPKMKTMDILFILLIPLPVLVVTILTFSKENNITLKERWGIITNSNKTTSTDLTPYKPLNTYNPTSNYDYNKNLMAYKLATLDKGTELIESDSVTYNRFNYLIKELSSSFKENLSEEQFGDMTYNAKKLFEQKGIKITCLQILENANSLDVNASKMITYPEYLSSLLIASSK